MNLNLEANKEALGFMLLPQAPLSWCSFGIETGALWFLGRGVFALQFERKLILATQEVEFKTLPLVKARAGLKFSNITNLAAMREENLFPDRLLINWQPPALDFLTNEIFLQFHSRPLNHTLGFLSYGLADMVTDLFFRGATIVRAQYSSERSQIVANIGLSERQLKDLMDENAPDYLGSDTVGDLPWPILNAL